MGYGLKIYSALYNHFHPFDRFYPDAERVHLEADKLPKENDGFLIVWGGGDIHPSWYNRVNIASHVWNKPSIRDEQEVRMMSAAIKLGLPIMGVCRGAQLGCAMAGGILVQDVEGHGRDHHMKTSDGRRFITSSLHHQMMYPWEVEHELLAWSDPRRSDSHYIGLQPEELKKAIEMFEPEIVWFPGIKCLAVQGHPEFMEHDSNMNIYVHELMDKHGFNHRPVS